MKYDKRIYPEKLNLEKGVHIRVIAPSRSLEVVGYDNIEIASKCLNDLGFKVSFSQNVFERDLLDTSSIQSRVSDIHEALTDPSVDCILTAIGGYSANQILDYLDYELIKANPKPICGFSDITTLSNAIYAQTRVVGYSGPHFSTFAMKVGLEYTIQNFITAMTVRKYEVKPAPTWSDDLWFENQVHRKQHYSDGPWIINPLEMKLMGVCLGGNLSSFRSLQGTKYFPSLFESIIMVEVTELNDIKTFERNLVSLTQQAGFESVKAILIGRFQKGSNIEKEDLVSSISKIKALERKPVIANLDFGHTTPIFTFPIGGVVGVGPDGDGITLTFE